MYRTFSLPVLTPGYYRSVYGRKLKLYTIGIDNTRTTIG